MVNQKFNKWTVVSAMLLIKNTYYCVCDCGQTGFIRKFDLVNNKSTQCTSCSAKINGRKGLDAQVKPNLYIVSCGEYIKIGSTDNIVKRLNTMKVGNPYPIILEYHGIGFGHMEPKLHTLYASKHHQGEWFLLSPRDILNSSAFISLTTTI